MTWLQILIQSVMETMVPKLVAEDIPLLNSLLSDVFPGVAYVPAEMTRLREEIAKVCREMFLTYNEVGSDEIGGQWVEKVCEHLSFPLVLIWWYLIHVYYTCVESLTRKKKTRDNNIPVKHGVNTSLSDCAHDRTVIECSLL